MSERVKRSVPANWQRLLVDNLYLYAVAALDLEGKFQTWNPGVKAVLGYDEAGFVGQPASILFTEEDRRAGIPELELRKAREQGNANDIRWHVRADGSRFWASGAITALKSDAGELLGYAKVVRDSSEQKTLARSLEHLNAHLETEIEARTADIRRLAVQLTLAEQGERKRLAQILHDSVQQELYAIQFSLNDLKKELEGRSALETLTSAEELLRKSMQLTRNVTTDLGPAILEETDMLSSLQWLANTMHDRYALDVEVTCDKMCPVENEAVHTLLLNLVRELLFNVVKHAGVHKASVHLGVTGNVLTLSVADEGNGLVPELTHDRLGTGLGLSGAQQRLDLLGGRLEVDASPGQGTRITITLPTSALILPL